MFKLDNKVIVLIGSNGYLGRNFSRAILEYGGTLHGCDKDTTEYEDVRELQVRYPDRFFQHEIDCAQKDEVCALRKSVYDKEGHVDVLINSVTMKGDDFYLPFEEVSLEGWNVGLLGNLTIPFLTTQAFISDFVRQQSGSIINIASHYGIVGNDQRIYEGSNLHEVYAKAHPGIDRIYSHGVYNSAKGGLINFTRYLAAYYGEYNVRANCISPGGVYQKSENKAFVEKYSAKVPLGRKAEPDEINGAVIFLASDASTYVTGHNLVVDGGYTIW